MFEAVEEPWGTWCVMDLLREVVAESGGEPLAGLDRAAAEAAVRLLSGDGTASGRSWQARREKLAC